MWPAREAADSCRLSLLVPREAMSQYAVHAIHIAGISPA